MRRLEMYAVAVLLVLCMVATPVLAKVNLGFDGLGRHQMLESEDPTNGDNGTEEDAFGSLRANLHIRGDINRYINVYTEAHINPVPVHDAADPLGTGASTSQVDQSPGDLLFKQGYITLNGYFQSVDLKGGEFEIDFGNLHHDRTDNGQSMDNPLVGNYLVDPLAVQPGVELSGEANQVDWVFGITNGSGDVQDAIGGGDQFSSESEYAWHAKISGQLMQRLNAAFSFYSSDQTDALLDTAGSDTGSFVTVGRSSPRRVHGSASSLFGSQGQQGIYQGLNNQSSPLMGAFANGGADVTAWQLDLDYELEQYPSEIEAHYGEFEDNGIGEIDSAGVANLPNDIRTSNAASGVPGPAPAAFASDQEWEYWGVQLVHSLMPGVHGAVRWGSTTGEVNSAAISNDLEYEKLQLGLGYQLTDRAIAKAEWVDQSVEEAPPSIVGSVNDSEEFNGLISEFAVTF